MTTATLQDAWAMWKAGEAHELSNVLGDISDGQDTFFAWDEESHDYPLPVFVFGDRDCFDRYYRTLCELSQATNS